MLTILSFGFKFGTPDGLGPHFIIDCRALPNPHGRPDMRELTGKDAPVQEFVKRDGRYIALTGDVDRLISEGAKVIAFGCVGGRHRSVTMAELTCDRLVKLGHDVEVVHREID
ncbi:MAG: hypothetical protein M9945_14030 [Aquamicrobium sp.]|uniref:RapZ C-terminal domain-containing protein n=1 Tax=Aquamicrobium sp. TaxID=1872579 RepID=UPI00349E9D8C|nr:hypothetical protein [Aquamicrobium sp.]